MEPILNVEEGPELVSCLLDKQVLDYRQLELAVAELRVHVPIINDKSPFRCARFWHKKPPTDPMGLAGNNPALFLKLFDFFTLGLFPKTNCTNGLVSLRLSIRNWLQDTNPIGTPFVLVFFNLRPMITSFLEHGIFEPVVSPRRPVGMSRKVWKVQRVSAAARALIPLPPDSILNSILHRSAVMS